MNSESSMEASSMDFPFLIDDKTVDYVGRSRTLFLLRGPPGSGISTLAKAIQEKYPGKSAICSAQSHLPAGQKPPFFKDVLEKAHAACEDSVRKLCKDGTPIIIVDNTNLSLWEIQKYSTIWHEFDYVDILVSPRTTWCLDPGELVKRSSRQFTLEVIQTKLKKFQTPIFPLFYGWFLNKQDSERLRKLGKNFYEQCISNMTFKEEFSKYLIPKTGDEHRDLQHYFSSADYKVGPLLLHCTAFFSNNGEISQSRAYASREAVRSENGKAFTLRVIGLLITPRSLGLRLKLGMSELPLWASEDEPPSKQPAEGDKSAAADDECVITPFSPTCGTGSRAHLSLGSGPGVEPVQTGLDLIEIIKMEQAAAQSGEKKESKAVIDLDGGCAHSFGDGNWMVYFGQEFCTEAIYSGYF